MSTTTIRITSYQDRTYGGFWLPELSFEEMIDEINRYFEKLNQLDEPLPELSDYNRIRSLLTISLEDGIQRMSWDRLQIWIRDLNYMFLQIGAQEAASVLRDRITPLHNHEMACILIQCCTATGIPIEIHDLLKITLFSIFTGQELAVE